MNRDISLSAIERIMKKAGAERVSRKAVEYLEELLEEIGKEITEVALEIARHGKRKTVTEDDLKLAFKYWKK